MQYIILDMEWNQAQPPAKAIREPFHLVGEIVQMGAVRLDEKFRPVDTFKIYITPKYYKRMNFRIARLTGISNADIRGGIPFPDALEAFRQWCGQEYCILTWGPDDIPMLRDNMRLHSLDDSNMPLHYNLQPVFDSQITHENRQCSLTYAMEKLGETPYREHDALNDALNTAVVCRHLDMEKGISEYESLKKHHEIHTEENSNSDGFRKIFSNRATALANSECKRIKCEACTEKAVCGNWVHQSGEKYISLARCKCGKEYFVRLILRKLSDDSVRATRLIYPLDDQRREYYISVSERNRRKNKRRFGHGTKK